MSFQGRRFIQVLYRQTNLFVLVYSYSILSILCYNEKPNIAQSEIEKAKRIKYTGKIEFQLLDKLVKKKCTTLSGLTALTGMDGVDYLFIFFLPPKLHRNCVYMHLAADCGNTALCDTWQGSVMPLIKHKHTAHCGF